MNEQTKLFVVVMILLVGRARSDKYDENIDFVVYNDQQDSAFLWTNESLVAARRCDKNGNL